MEIKFKTGKPPVVKFSKTERMAVLTVLETLRTYGERMEIDAAADGSYETANQLAILAESIGLKE